MIPVRILIVVALLGVACDTLGDLLRRLQPKRGSNMIRFPGKN